MQVWGLYAAAHDVVSCYLELCITTRPVEFRLHCHPLGLRWD